MRIKTKSITIIVKIILRKLSFPLRINYKINNNIKVSGNVKKTITTIDRGALANAYAQREANRINAQRLELEKAEYFDEKERQKTKSKVSSFLKMFF